MLRRAALLTPVVPPAVITGAMFFSLLGDGHNGFWSDHPMLGALVSGVLLFVAGAFVIDRIIQRRNSRRWAAVSVAAARDLGHLLDECLKELWLAHSAPDPDGDAQPSNR